jgi:hypothetical protein
MATYNGGRYIREQLSSIATQTHRIDELVVSDDGSTDDTLSILRNFADDAGFSVRILQNAHRLGYPQNFSRALSGCIGDIVFLADQDDVWFPRKVATTLEVFSRAPKILYVIHDLEICRDDLTSLGETMISRRHKDTDLQRDYCTGAAVAVRGAFLRLCLPIPDLRGITHDAWLNRCAWLLGSKTIHGEALVKFRRHTNNSSSGMDPATIGHKTNRWRLLFMRFQRPVRLSHLQGVPYSPWIHWLEERAGQLVSRGYVTNKRIRELVALETKRSRFMNERLRYLTLPRHQRVGAILRGVGAGNYRAFSMNAAAIKDLMVGC